MAVYREIDRRLRQLEEGASWPLGETGAWAVAPAGDADASGNYPEGSVNRRVAARLAELSEIRKSFSRPADKTVKKQTKED